MTAPVTTGKKIVGAPSSEQLLDEARRAAGRSYSPYSRFQVGAAAYADDGKVYVGCNVENASYGLSVCAERVAIFKALSEGARRIHKLAVSCVDADSEASAEMRMPCGACRQVIAEFADEGAVIVVDGVEGELSLEGLLPKAFSLRRRD